MRKRDARRLSLSAAGNVVLFLSLLRLDGIVHVANATAV
jgi:hypothetical protein